MVVTAFNKEKALCDCGTLRRFVSSSSNSYEDIRSEEISSVLWRGRFPGRLLGWGPPRKILLNEWLLLPNQGQWCNHIKTNGTRCHVAIIVSRENTYCAPDKYVGSQECRGRYHFTSQLHQHKICKESRAEVMADAVYESSLQLVQCAKPTSQTLSKSVPSVPGWAHCI